MNAVGLDAARAVQLSGAGGLRIAGDAWGDPSRPAVLLFHGGGQTRGAWAQAGRRLAALGWYAIAVDLRGHGESDWSPDGSYAIELFADDVRTLACGFDRPVLVGASLGGISSLLAAGEAPAVNARSLVLVDIAHRPRADGVARILAFMSANPDGFASLEEAAAAVAGYLPQRAAPDSVDGLRRNLRRRGDRWVWHWDPRILSRWSTDDATPRAAAFAAERLVAAARAVSAPILLVRGAMSDVVSADIAREFSTLVPGVASVDVAGAGHMVAGDRNDRFVDAILPFLREAA